MFTDARVEPGGQRQFDEDGGDGHAGPVWGTCERMDCGFQTLLHTNRLRWGTKRREGVGEKNSAKNCGGETWMTQGGTMYRSGKRNHSKTRWGMEAG